jgi:hypothetical protein
MRQRAYRIWIEEGCPEGRADVHWEMAIELLAIEENQELTLKQLVWGRAARRSNDDRTLSKTWMTSPHSLKASFRLRHAVRVDTPRPASGQTDPTGDCRRWNQMQRLRLFRRVRVSGRNLGLSSQDDLIATAEERNLRTMRRAFGLRHSYNFR